MKTKFWIGMARNPPQRKTTTVRIPPVKIQFYDNDSGPSFKPWISKALMALSSGQILSFHARHSNCLCKMDTDHRYVSIGAEMDGSAALLLGLLPFFMGRKFSKRCNSNTTRLWLCADNAQNHVTREDGSSF